MELDALIDNLKFYRDQGLTLNQVIEMLEYRESTDLSNLTESVPGSQGMPFQT